MALSGFAPGLSAAATPDLLGADEAIARVGKAAGTEGVKKTEPGKDEAERLKRDLESFKKARGTLPAGEAADQWLKLYDRFLMLPPDAVAGRRPNPFAPPRPDDLSMGAIVSALPPPAAWDALKTRVLARKPADGGAQETVLRLLTYYLTRDRENLEKGLAEFKAGMALGGNRSSSFFLRDLRPDTDRRGSGKGGAAIVEAFAAYLQALGGERPEGRMTVQVPDLVALAGEKRAEELILKAIAIPGLALNVPSGGSTLELAKRLVLKNADKLTEPQWELVTSTADTELYEALDRRFPEKTGKEQASPDLFREVDKYAYRSSVQDSARRKAKFTYVMGLVARGRVGDATARAKLMEPDDFQCSDFDKVWHSFDKLRFAPGLRQFCRGVLSERPELPLWKQCGLLASDAGDARDLVAIIDGAAQKPGLGLDLRLGIRERKVDLLLAMDRADEAVSLLREMLKTDAGREAPPVQLAVARVKLGLAPRLCVLGRLLAQPELVTESEEVFLAVIGGVGAQLTARDISVWDVRSADSPVGSMVEAFLESGDFARAERIVMLATEAILKTPELAAIAGGRDLALASGVLAGNLVRLAEIYDRAGRHGDVLTLLEKAGWWGATDLIDLAEEHKTLPPIAARALHQAGRDDEAVAILKEHLLGNPGDDAAYATLTEILGPAAIPWLDALQARDRFEERPLIWKTQLLKREGKLDEAEATVREALKIDPTDGEQKAGDRGRAYVVLADVLRAKGKGDDAAFFDRVVASVRTAEKGDRFTEAGLLRKSLALYEEAASSFADAYCVQWRLAERLSSMGDMEGARKHYEIAFERMPEQFGQVARFCFGCEGVFTHQQSVSVAEEVLTGLARTAPQKPQVQYLLGQLRESQGRKADAYRHFRTAAELDPRYLDALKEAYALRNDVFLSREEADEIALRMVRLDPLGRHNGVNAGEISDLKGLWSVYEEAAAATGRPTAPRGLLPLTASKRELEVLVQKFGGSLELLEWKRSSYREHRAIPEPGDAVARNVFVQKLLQASGQGGMMLE